MSRGRVYFDTDTQVGTEATYTSVGPTWNTTATGTYLGLQDRGDGPYHYFDGGTIGDTRQNGMHGFPADKCTGTAYVAPVATRTVGLLRLDHDEMTDGKSLDLTIVRVTEDDQREAVHGWPVGLGDVEGVAEVPLTALLQMVVSAAVEMGYDLASDWVIGVDNMGLYAEATATAR